MKNEAGFLTGAEIYHRNERNGAPLLKLPNGVALKLFLKKAYPLHLLRVLTKTTKAHKQWKAAQKLLSIGLNTPKPISVEVFNGKGNYEACFKYQFLEHAKPMSEALSKQSDRKNLLGKLAHEIGHMYSKGLLFIDFHLDNILVDKQGNLWWIDPELTYDRNKVKSIFWSRMERMHTKCNPGILDEKDWEHFKRFLQHHIGKENIPL